MFSGTETSGGSSRTGSSLTSCCASAGSGAQSCVAGAFLYYHAPKADGVLHVEQSAQPSTCLLSAEAAASFSAAR